MTRAQSGAEWSSAESSTGTAAPGVADGPVPGGESDQGESQYVGPLHWEVLGSGMVIHDLPEWRAYTGQASVTSSSGWLLSVVHPNDRERTEQAWTLALSTRSPYQVEHRLRGADGSYRPFLSQARPVLAADGSIEQWHGVSTDISAVKRQTLVERWRAQTFASNHDAIIVSDTSGRILDWNPAAERIYGYSRDEMLGHTTGKLHVPEEHTALVTRIQEAIARDGRWTGEIAFLRKDGSTGISETTIQQILDPEGTPIGTFGVNRDISARKVGEAESERLLRQEQATRQALEEALAAARVSEQRFQKILEKNIIGMNIADSEHIIEANDAFLSMLGYTREEMRAGAISWKRLSPPEDKLVDDRASQELAQRGACTPYEKTYLRKDGTPVPIILCGVLLELQPLRVASFVLDISDRKRSEAEREKLLRREQETNRRMDEFLGIASHELRTPLTSIKMNLQVTARVLTRYLQSHPTNDPALERATRLLTLTDRQSERLDRLVEDLLDVSRIQSGTLRMEPEQCDLVAVVSDVVNDMGLAWHGRDLSFEAPPGSVEVRADGGRIGQVVTNLLSNALKYSAEAAPVRVRLRVEQGHARVEVRDGGPGLPSQEIPHIWERFHRAPGVEVKSGSGVGLGLGLHISKTIVERHGGTVGVESALGVGSTFWFTLPLSQARE